MPLSELAPAKINLTLRIVGRRDDGYHELESLVAFASLADTISLSPGGTTSLVSDGQFANAAGPADANLVIKATNALAALVPGLRGGAFALTKTIPVAAGLGGGSSDAAAALRLLAKTNSLAAGDPRIMAAARATGADVPVCLEHQPRVMRGIGEQLSPPVVLPKLDVVLVNPGVAVSTKDVFAVFDARYATARPIEDIPAQYEPLLAWLGSNGNDLTEAASLRAPVIRDVVGELSLLYGCRLTRMTGSGATCFAIFDEAAEADAAAERLQAAHPAWWIKSAVVG